MFIQLSYQYCDIAFESFKQRIFVYVNYVFRFLCAKDFINEKWNNRDSIQSHIYKGEGGGKEVS
jgi:hypothetical protein